MDTTRKKIDFHTHVGEWQEYHRAETARDFETILTVMDECGIERIVLFVGGTQEEEYCNGITFSLARSHPNRVVPFAVVNPHYEDGIAERLSGYVQRDGIRGIKLHPDVFRRKVTEPVYERIFSAANEHGLIVLSHTWHESAFCAPELFGEIADSYPSARIVLGHAGGVRKDGATRIAAEHNVYLELSTSFTYLGSLERMVDAIGSERILYGSDMPFIDPRTTIGWIEGSGISEDAKNRIFYENAAALLGPA
jgi:uncharacterized protein